MSNVKTENYEDNMLVYWFDFWFMESGIGLTISSKIELDENWVEVLTEYNASFVVIKMPTSFIFKIDKYSSYESFKSIIKKKNRREWRI